MPELIISLLQCDEVTTKTTVHKTDVFRLLANAVYSINPLINLQEIQNPKNNAQKMVGFGQHMHVKIINTMREDNYTE